MTWIEKYVSLFGGDIGIAILVGVLTCAAFLLVGFICAVLYGTSVVCLNVKRAFAERKRRRLEKGRKVRYTLPDKENSYLRARLFTALKPEEGEETEYVEQRTVGVRLGYTRKMLAGVREASLSPIERLDVEEMARLVALYSEKEKWSGSDLKAVNEIFARLLKLSAKYEIAV